MKTSLLNRLQSPIPTAENTPQTNPVSTTETTGFSGLFQKAIGWLSPKSPAIDSSNGTLPADIPSLPNENSNAISVLGENNSIPTSVLTPLNGNGSKEIAKGLVDTLGVAQDTILQLADKGIVIPNSEGIESHGFPIAENAQTSQPADIFTRATENTEVNNTNGLIQIPSAETPESNPTSIDLQSNTIVNVEGDINSDSSSIVRSESSPLHLEDVVASVYAAIQTNLPAENVDITFLPTGKNSAEITLAIKDTSPENAESETQKTVDSHQILEALSQHIGSIQKKLGNSATVTFGFSDQEVNAGQTFESSSINETPIFSNEVLEVTSKSIQSEDSGTNAVINNQNTQSLTGKKLINELNPEHTPVSENGISIVDTDKAKSVPKEINDNTDNSAGIQDNAMIAAAMLSTIQLPTQVISTIEAEGSSEIESQNVSTENTSFQIDKSSTNSSKLNNASKSVPSSNIESNSNPISFDSTTLLHDASQNVIDNSADETVDTVKVEVKTAPKSPIEVPSELVSENIVQNPLPKQSNGSADQVIQPEFGNVISTVNQEINRIDSTQANSSEITNTVVSAMKNATEDVSFVTPEVQLSSVGNSTLAVNNKDIEKTVESGHVIQPKIIIETKDNEVISAPAVHSVLDSNQTPNNSDSTQVITEETAPKNEVPKLSFNSVRELLDESERNGITVSSLVIKVETPVNVAAEKQFVEVSSPKIELSSMNRISSDDPEAVLQSEDNFPDLKIPVSDKVQSSTSKSDMHQTAQTKPELPADVELHDGGTNVTVSQSNGQKSDTINENNNTPVIGNPIPLNTDVSHIDLKIPSVSTMVDTPKVNVSEAIIAETPITPQVRQSVDGKKEEALKTTEEVPVKPSVAKVNVDKLIVDTPDFRQEDISSQATAISNSKQSEEPKTTVTSVQPNVSFPKSEPVKLEVRNEQNTHNAEYVQNETVKSESNQTEYLKSELSNVQVKSNDTSVGSNKNNSVKPESANNGIQLKTAPIVEIVKHQAVKPEIAGNNTEVQTASIVETVKPQVVKPDSVKQEKQVGEVPVDTSTNGTVKPDTEERQTTAKLDTPKIEVSSKSKTETTVKPQNEEVKLTSPKTEIPVELKSNPTSINNNDVAPNLKVETPKGSAAKSEVVKPEMIVRENQPVNAAQSVQESIPSTIQTHDVSAIASAQKPVIAPKSETKTEKKATKIDSSEVTINSDSKEQLPLQVTERNASNQNEQQKPSNRNSGVAKKNFETTIAQEVQSGGVEVPKEESVSKSDSIRAKEKAETNSPTQTTNTALFQPVVAPVKNYQGIDSAKKTIPRVDVENFAPATAQLVKTLPQQTGGTVRMQLTPDALGPVTVQVNVRDKNAALRIDVETNAAKQALEAQIPVLREQLTQQGITAERIEIQVRPREDFSMFSGFNQQNSSARQEEQQARQSYLRTFAEGREERQDAIIQDIAPKIKEKKTTVQNRVEFYA